jgi:putative FmdB family regulatory protein
MPLYAYTCPNCGQRFEKLISISRRDQPVTCEACGHPEVRRSIDSFRAALGSTSGSTPSFGGGSGCGSGGFS